MINASIRTIRLLVIIASLWCTMTWSKDFHNTQQLALISQIASIVQGDDKPSSAGTATAATSTAETAEVKKTGDVLRFAEPITSLDINIEEKFYNSPEAKKLHRLLGIKNKKYHVIYLVNSKPLGRFDLNDNIISVQTRSFITMMDFLSNGVQVPPQALEEGVVLSAKYPDGKFYDLSELTKGLFCAQMSHKRPQRNVNVEVYYRNHWFYIRDTDLKSKRTLALVQQIFNFLSGNAKTQTGSPILTIPVA